MTDSYDTLAISWPSPHILLVTLNRPGAMNAINTQMGRDLLSVLTTRVRDDAVRAVVLTGAGERAFSAGG